MRETKLILIDGLPGSGKSTTTEMLDAAIRRDGRLSHAYIEWDRNHPLNVGGELHPSGDTTGEAFFRQYTVESFIAESVSRWRMFVRDATPTGIISIFDSYPFQNSVRVLLQLDAGQALIQEYADQVETLMQPLSPVLLYFNRRDVAESITRISAQRGAAWTAYAIDVITNCPYARARHLQGFDGALAMLNAYKALMEELLARSHLPRLIMDECPDHWQACYEQMSRFLGLDLKDGSN